MNTARRRANALLTLLACLFAGLTVPLFGDDTPAPKPVPPTTTAPSATTKPFEIYTAFPFDAKEAVKRQDDTAAALGIPKLLTVDLAGTPMKLILIPAGHYQDEAKHDLTVDKPFYMAQFKVTQTQFQKVMGKNVSAHPADGDFPVDSVKWADAHEFCKTASAKTKQKFALASNLQWEYACRAGTNTRCYWGDDMAKLGDYCWYRENMGGIMHPVGKKLPNAFQLYDMMGLAWEWVSDGGPDAPKHDSRSATWGSREMMFKSSTKWTTGDADVNDRWGMRVILELEDAPSKN